jgi:hypothetical protein
MDAGGRLWTETSRSHGENWGSIPHGSANQIKRLALAKA